MFDEARAEEVRERIIPLFDPHLRIALPFVPGSVFKFRDEDFIVTYLPDGLLKDFLLLAIKRNIKVGFLPHPGMAYARHGFGISGSPEDAAHNILKTEVPQKVDILMANGRPVFDTVVIGNSLSLMYGSAELSRTKRIWGKIKSFINLFKRLELKEYIIEYKEKEEGKEKVTLHTAALGMVVVQHGKSSLLSRRIIENSFVNDGMMHNLILAPESVMGLVKFSIMSFFRTNRNPRLPPFAAHIKTNKIKVLSRNAIELSVDGSLLSAKEVELEVVSKAMQIVPGLYLDTESTGNNKEVFKTQILPHGEKRDELLKGPLPFIRHATSEEFKDLFTVLRGNAKVTSAFQVLMFLSSFIATLGLFSNSSPVIIGAMILAPLMNPIISLSMGVLRQEKSLVRNSLLTIGTGVLWGYVCAVFITLILPLPTINTEILARVRPNLLDLGVAVGSGVAGAYAHSKKEIAKTLAGVAIAVALVPPLAVSGIGLGWLDWNVFSGALLLLITNFTGMVLAAAITFLFLGFSPFHLARKGLLIALVCVIGVSAPLAFGFLRMVEENRIIRNLNGRKIDSLILREVDVRSTDPLRLSIKIVTEKPLTEKDLKIVKQKIEELLGEETELELTVGIKL